MIVLAVILIIIVAGGVFGLVAFSYVKNKADRMLRSAGLGNVGSMLQMAQQMSDEATETPLSVSGMTRLALPRITKDFPDFEYEEMRNRTNQMLTSYLRAVTSRDESLLEDCSSELKAQLQAQVQAARDRDLREHFESIHIHQTEISQYQKTSGRCIITFQTALECYHYLADNNGNVVEGEKSKKYQTKFDTELIYIQDRDKVENMASSAIGVNCPNCGAPLTSLGAKKCQYCGSPVIEINIHAWTFGSITEKR